MQRQIRCKGYTCKQNRVYTNEEKKFKSDKKKYEQGIAKNLKSTRNLVYIGRGSVKVGFKLDSIMPEDLIIEKNKDTTNITLIVDAVQILSNDINPWYIKTKNYEVEGYELFMKKGKDRDFTNEEITRVKVKCREKLLEQALQKGIIKKAEESGFESLKMFFNLLGIPNLTIKYREKPTA